MGRKHLHPINCFFDSFWVLTFLDFVKFNSLVFIILFNDSMKHVFGVNENYTHLSEGQATFQE
jgi:hypothetical protein